MARSITKFGKFDKYSYIRQGETSYYQKTKGDDRMPEELRTEAVRFDEKYRTFGVTEFLSSRQKNGQTLFKTGLQKCHPHRPFWYAGDWLHGGTKSLVAMAFNDDRTTLEVYVFRGLWKERTSHRLNYVRQFLQNQYTKSIQTYGNLEDYCND
jgi:hypothetical protein